MKQLLPNRTAKIRVDTPDYFDYVDKGSAIKYFLEIAGDSLKGNNMIVLYGEWGSGKSTLMEYIKTELEKGKLYKTVFFTAWEHEKDHNLALSLVDAITARLGKNVVVKEFIKEAADFLINLKKGLTVKTPDSLGFGFEYDFDKMHKAIEESYEKEEKDWSFYKKLSEFKEKYKKMEDGVLGKNEKLIVFIDDLDRCEPENVLTLLSAIKLFFSLGERTIFFFGIDKDAVTNAVKTKYGDIIKSNEYMEKVFDISFEMPKNTSISSLVSNYFNSPADTEKVTEFFKAIDFTTPRHLKKVLNKYLIVRTLKSKHLQLNIKKLIQNIKDEHNLGSIMSTIFTLFIIIIYEYNYDLFEDLEDYEGKVVEYIKIVEKGVQTAAVRNFNTTLNTITNENNGCCFPSIKGQTMHTLLERSKAVRVDARNSSDRSEYKRFTRFLTLFTPKKIDKFDFDITEINEEDFIKQFDIGANKILINFCFFLLRNRNEITASDYEFSNLFLMARTIL